MASIVKQQSCLMIYLTHFTVHCPCPFSSLCLLWIIVLNCCSILCQSRQDSNYEHVCRPRGRRSMINDESCYTQTFHSSAFASSHCVCCCFLGCYCHWRSSFSSSFSYFPMLAFIQSTLVQLSSSSSSSSYQCSLYDCSDSQHLSAGNYSVICKRLAMFAFD